jgi:hypothetical protein
MSQWGNDPQIPAGMIGDSEEDHDPSDDLTLSTTAATRASCGIAEPQQTSNPPACDRSLLSTRARFLHSIDALGQGSGDPFGSLPGLAEGDIDFLVHHCQCIFTFAPGLKVLTRLLAKPQILLFLSALAHLQGPERDGSP